MASSDSSGTPVFNSSNSAERTRGFHDASRSTSANSASTSATPCGDSATRLISYSDASCGARPSSVFLIGPRDSRV
eukprot:scaffold65901_cov31-Tisochrysis_lutea.AAC.1